MSGGIREIRGVSLGGVQAQFRDVGKIARVSPGALAPPAPPRLADLVEFSIHLSRRPARNHGHEPVKVSKHAAPLGFAEFPDAQVHKTEKARIRILAFFEVTGLAGHHGWFASPHDIS